MHGVRDHPCSGQATRNRETTGFPPKELTKPALGPAVRPRRLAQVYAPARPAGLRAVDGPRAAFPPQLAKHYEHCGPWPRGRHSAAPESLPSVRFTQLLASRRCRLAGETALSSDPSTRAGETTDFPQSELTLQALWARSALPAHRPRQGTMDGARGTWIASTTRRERRHRSELARESHEGSPA